MNLSSLSHYYIQELIRSFCEETGHVCPHWPDKKIVSDLCFLDSKDKGNRLNEYLARCHELQLLARPPPEGEGDDWLFSMSCEPNNLRSMECCDYQNNAAIENFKKFFLQIREESENAPMSTREGDPGRPEQPTDEENR